MPSVVITMMNQYRAALLAQEEAAMRVAAQAWLQVEQTLQAQIEVLAQQMASENVVTMGAIVRMKRYQALQVQVDKELSRYARLTEGRIVDGQRDMATRAAQQASATVRAVATEAGISVNFDRLPISATENMIGIVADGTPLRAVLADASGVGQDAMAQMLVRGTALGVNPLKVAADAMRNGLGQSFTRMQTISRTEMLRTERTTTLMSYQSSNVISGYVRLSGRDDRVCPACLFADGTFYPLGEGFAAHPNCRCSLYPRLKNVPPPAVETGQAWFLRQPEKTQRAMLGPGRFKAWQSGASLDSMVTTVPNDTWGASLQVTRVRDLP